MMEQFGTLQLSAIEGKPVIGDGLEYTIYDLGNGRVLKRPKTPEEQRAKLISWGIVDEGEIEAKLREMDMLSHRSVEKTRSLLEDNKLSASLLGNPIFGPGLEYSQDKSTALHEYINSHSLEENKNEVEKYISLTHQLWKSGMADTIFNFTVNNGVSKDGSSVHLDIGEFVFEKSEIAEFIKKKIWLEKYSYTQLKDSVLQEFVAQKFDEAFTLEKLDELWPAE